MSSGIEVMICHAENLSRHLEKMREDLTELRMRERLLAEEPSTSEHLASGTTNLGNTIFIKMDIVFSVLFNSFTPDHAKSKTDKFSKITNQVKLKNTAPQQSTA